MRREKSLNPEELAIFVLKRRQIDKKYLHHIIIEKISKLYNFLASWLCFLYHDKKSITTVIKL